MLLYMPIGLAIWGRQTAMVVKKVGKFDNGRLVVTAEAGGKFQMQAEEPK